jgi:arabinoxylan arabinofuranohydrolase
MLRCVGQLLQDHGNTAGHLISIGDIGLPGVTAENARNFTGNTHGGMVCVKGQWYIFYHRQTNRQKVCAAGMRRTDPD